MVTLQILVLPFLVRVRVAQQKIGIHRKMDPFFVYDNDNEDDNGECTYGAVNSDRVAG